MQFKVTEIAPEGRNKYGNYFSKGNTARGVVQATYGGNSTTNDISVPDTQITPQQTDQYYVQIQEPSVEFTSEEVTMTTTKTIGFNAMRGTDFIPIYIMDISRVGGDSATTFTAPTNNGVSGNTTGGVSGVPMGMGLSFPNNGTSAASISITSRYGGFGGNGKLYIPITIYQGKGTQPLGAELYPWMMQEEDLQTIWVDLNWNVTTADTADSVYLLDLSNEIAGVNCDSGGTVVPGAILPECTAKFYYGTQFIPSAFYSIYTAPNYNATGVSGHNTSNGFVVDFDSDFGFDGTTLQIVITATYNGNSYSKTMSVVKNLPGATGPNGEPGADAVTYWLQTTPNELIFNPNTSGLTDVGIRAYAWKQVGGNTPQPISWDRIYYQTQNRSNNWWNSQQQIQNDPEGITGVTIDASSAITYSNIRFKLYDNSAGTGTTLDAEDVPILTDGTNGSSGATGRAGAAIRGPIDWYSGITANRRFCNGEGPTTEDTQWIDILLKDGTYYRCTTSYEHIIGMTWAQVSSNWTSADTSYDFVATQVLLAEDAKIKFLTGNDIYLMSGDTITAGMAGGSGYSFWAGAENGADAKFSVDAEGNMVAKNASFSGSIYATNGIFAGYIQYPYQPMSILPINGNMYVADTEHPYLINNTNIPAAATRCSGYVDTEGSNRTYGTYLKLPEPTEALNGFTYRIVIGDYQAGENYSSIFLYQTTNYRHITNTIGDRVSPTRVPTAAYSGYCLQSGAFVITCLPSPNANGDVNYHWYITDGQPNWVRIPMGMPQQVPFIRVIPSTANTTAAATTGLTEVDCNTHHWDINYDTTTSWISCTKAGNGVWWSIPANTTGTARRGYIYLRGYNASSAQTASGIIVIAQSA